MNLPRERKQSLLNVTAPPPLRRILGATTIAVVCGTGIFPAAPTTAATPPERLCRAAKERAAGRYAKCLAAVTARAVRTGVVRDASRCVTRLEKSFTKAESKGGGACLTSGDAAATIETIGGCLDDVTTDILNGTPPPGSGGPTARCDSRKTRAPGRYIKCLMRARAKASKWGVFPDPTDTDKCADKLLASIDLSNGDPQSPCSVVADELSILAAAGACPLDFSTDVTTPITGSFTMSCDLGIAVVPLSMDLTVTPSAAFEQGIPQTVDTQLTVVVDETLVGALLSLGAMEVQLDSATSLSTIAGAAGGPVANVIPGTPFLIDLTLDTDVPPNGTPGPVVIVSNLASAALTVDPGATSVDFELDSADVNLSMVPVLETLNLICVRDLMAGDLPISFPVQ